MKLRMIMTAAVLSAMLGVTAYAADEPAAEVLPEFEYSANDRIQAAVISTILSQADELFDEGTLSVPCAVLEYFNEEDPSRPIVWGSFGVTVYTLENDVLVEQNDYSSRGRALLTAQEDGTYTLDSWDTEGQGIALEDIEGWNEAIAAAMEHIDEDRAYAKTAFLEQYCRSDGLPEIRAARFLDGTEIDLSGITAAAEEEPAEDENSAEMYPAFEYDGTDSIEAAVSAAVLLMQDEAMEDMRQNLVAIPCPVIRVIDMSDPSRIEVWGDFGLYNYSVSENVLHEEAGFHERGKMILETAEDGSCRVTETALAKTDDELDSIDGYTPEIAASLTGTSDDRENVRVRFLTMYCRTAPSLGITSCVLVDDTEIDLSGAYEAAPQ